MIDLNKHVIFMQKSAFLQEMLIQQFVPLGLDTQAVVIKDKKMSDRAFFDKLAQVPMFGIISLGFLDAEGEYENDKYNSIIDAMPSHSYVAYRFDRLPGRISVKIKNNVYFRGPLEEAEKDELLSNYLTVLHKRISASARNFLMNKLDEEPEKVMPILSKLASYTPHLYLDEQIIKNSFDEVISAFQVPEAFFKSKGIYSSLIIDKIEFNQFVPLFLGYLMRLIQFKIAENKSLGEKMRIIKASPDTIRRFEDTVKPFTQQSLEAMFLYYSSAARFGKDEFLIKHLTRGKL